MKIHFILAVGELLEFFAILDDNLAKSFSRISVISINI